MNALINARMIAAIKPPRKGEITQLAAMADIVAQFTALKPTAAMPPPITPPTTECVVDTGALKYVARLTQRADAKRADIMAQMKVWLSFTKDGLMIPFAMVLTTSPPAKRAPALSKTAAIIRAPNMVSALEPTAGPTLFATSFAPMFRAM